MSKVDPVEVARVFAVSSDPTKPHIGYDECLAMARVVLAAAEVCSHQGVERVILDVSLTDDIKALKAALEGR